MKKFKYSDIYYFVNDYASKIDLPRMWYASLVKKFKTPTYFKGLESKFSRKGKYQTRNFTCIWGFSSILDNEIRGGD